MGERKQVNTLLTHMKVRCTKWPRIASEPNGVKRLAWQRDTKST